MLVSQAADGRWIPPASAPKPRSSLPSSAEYPVLLLSPPPALSSTVCAARIDGVRGSHTAALVSICQARGRQ